MEENISLNDIQSSKLCTKLTLVPFFY